MQEMKQRFEAYGGDYQTTMARFMGNEKLYLKFLGMFFQDENLQRLGQALEAEDLKGAFEAAHTLKGVAANLGLAPLYEAVCTIVEPLRAGEARADYPQLYQQVQVQADRVQKLWEDLKQ